jgi:hypothetical protein
VEVVLNLKPELDEKSRSKKIDGGRVDELCQAVQAVWRELDCSERSSQASTRFLWPQVAT